MREVSGEVLPTVVEETILPILIPYSLKLLWSIKTTDQNEASFLSILSIWWIQIFMLVLNIEKEKKT